MKCLSQEDLKLQTAEHRTGTRKDLGLSSGLTCLMRGNRWMFLLLYSERESTPALNKSQPFLFFKQSLSSLLFPTEAVGGK